MALVLFVRRQLALFAPEIDPRLLVRSARLRDERVSRGLTPTPAKVTLTRRADLDPGAAFFTALTDFTARTALPRKGSSSFATVWAELRTLVASGLVVAQGRVSPAPARRPPAGTNRPARRPGSSG